MYIHRLKVCVQRVLRRATCRAESQNTICMQAQALTRESELQAEVILAMDHLSEDSVSSLFHNDARVSHEFHSHEQSVCHQKDRSAQMLHSLRVLGERCLTCSAQGQTRTQAAVIRYTLPHSC